MFCRQRCSALCWCNLLGITLCVTYPVLYYPVCQSVVYHPIVNCRCLQHLPPPQCAVSSTHFAMVVKATRAGILWNWNILDLRVFTIDLAEENDFHIANNSNLQVGSYFYDRNSVTCTSEFRDPKQSRESTERALQHSVKFRNLPKAQRIVRWQQRVINRVQRMVKFNKIAKMGFLAQAGFRQLCRLWVPDLTSEEAPATDLSSINNQHQDEEDNNHDVSDLHPLLPLCVCVLDKLCDRPKGSFWWFSTAVSIETRKELGPRVSHSVLKIPQHCLGIGGTLQKTALQRNKRWRVAKLCIAGSSNTCGIMLMPKMSLLNSCLGSFVSSSAQHRSA